MRRDGRMAKWCATAAIVVASTLGIACDALVDIPSSITEQQAVHGIRNDAADARMGNGLHDASTARDAGDATHPRDAGDATKPNDAGDASRPKDAGHAVDASEAGPSAGAAVMVSSDTFKRTWCAVTVGGDIECWGDNSWGELGDGTFTSSTTPVKVIGLPGPATQVAVGTGFVCACLADGSAWCWGLGNQGQLGNGTTTEYAPTPVQVYGLGPGAGVTAISTGNWYSCALRVDGSVWCWGADWPGTLAARGNVAFSVPTEMPGLSSGVTGLSVGFDLACVVVNGGVQCWGGFEAVGAGQLGNGTTNASAFPVAVTGLASGVASVSVGDFFACALSTGGEVSCWGSGTGGQLGNGQFASSPSPVPVSELSSGVKAISAGSEEACALKEDSSVWCWGSGGTGQLGDGPWQDAGPLGHVSGVPVEVEGLPSGGVTSISSGDAPCVVTKSGGIDCWGATDEYAYAPVPVSNLTTKGESVSVGGGGQEQFACALVNHSVGCWGDNTAGELGNGTMASTATPVSVLGTVSSISASMGGTFACAVQGGLVQCWGENSSGQLGNDSTNSSSSPVSVQGLPSGGAVAVSSGLASACALMKSGVVYCWGDNNDGELGDGTTANSRVAKAVSTLTSGVTAVSVGYGFACAIVGGASLECWGSNGSGQLGNGTEASSLVPTPVPGLGNVTAVSAGVLSTCAVDEGALYCWGDNSINELGNYAAGSSSSTPVAVPTLSTGVTEVAMGSDGSCAIANGGAWCWGTSGIGNAGYYNGTTTGPIPVTGLSSGVTAIAAGASSACAVQSGAVLCWGDNSSGQLGNGGVVDHLVATPVSGFP